MLVGVAVLTTAAFMAPPAKAQAQQQSTAPDGANLTLTASAFGGYDTDVTGSTVNPSDVRPSASSAGAIVTLNYRIRSDRIGFGTRASLDSRYYNTDPAIRGTSYSGLTVFGAELSSRLRVDASASGVYSPQFAFNVFAANDIPEDLPPPTLDYGVTPYDVASYFGTGSATFQVTRRSSLTASYSAGQYRYLDDDYSMTTRSYGGGFSHGLTRYASLQLGYAQLEAEYPAFGGAERTPLKQRYINAGVSYSRPLSVSRRTTLSFGTGSAVLDYQQETFYTVTGNAALRHQFKRTWNVTAGYSRGLGVVVGFAEPFLADAASASVTGNLSRNTRMLIGTGFTDGDVGLGSLAENFRSFQSTARVEYAITERVAIFSNYFFYSYDFGEGFRPRGVPVWLDRHGVRGGVIVRFPLVEERTTRVTR